MLCTQSGLRSVQNTACRFVVNGYAVREDSSPGAKYWFQDENGFEIQNYLLNNVSFCCAFTVSVSFACKPCLPPWRPRTTHAPHLYVAPMCVENSEKILWWYGGTNHQNLHPLRAKVVPKTVQLCDLTTSSVTGMVMASLAICHGPWSSSPCMYTLPRARFSFGRLGNVLLDQVR
jgi:hypothetical protein